MFVLVHPFFCETPSTTIYHAHYWDFLHALRYWDFSTRALARRSGIYHRVHVTRPHFLHVLCAVDLHDSLLRVLAWIRVGSCIFIGFRSAGPFSLGTFCSPASFGSAVLVDPARGHQFEIH